MTRLRTQASADAFFGLAINERGQRTWREEIPMKVQIELQYNGCRVMVPVDVAEDEVARMGEVIAGAISTLAPQGFTVPTGVHMAPTAPAQTASPFRQRMDGPAQQAPPQLQQQQGRCPHHGGEKGRVYQGRWECAVTTTFRPNYEFEDKGQGYTFLGKSDGLPRYVCAYKDGITR